MVDFQERDTRRGLDEAEGADAAASDEGGDTDHDHSRTDHSDDHRHEHEHGHEDGHHDQGHHHHAHDREQVGAGVVTVSSTRSLDADPSGDAIAAAFADAGHEIATRELVGDTHDRIQKTVDTLVRRKDVDVVVTTGGTGVTPDDVTVEAVRSLFSKRLPGFGELFRRRSEADIGTRIIATRAEAGVAKGTPVFCLPGSEDAVRLGTEEIILPEIGHLVGLAARNEEVEE